MFLNSKTVFIKLDLQRACLQIPVAECDIPKTAVCTPFGLFEYNFMPYSLKDAGATLQRYIHTILANTNNTFCYLDDILVPSASLEEHLHDQNNVLAVIAEHKSTN